MRPGRAWFEAPDGGRFAFEIVRLIESPGLAQALVRYRYAFTTPAGAQETSAWLTLSFALEEGAWRLVYDRNTAIAPAPAQ